MNYPELVDEELLERVLNEELPKGNTHRTSINVLEACEESIGTHDGNQCDLNFHWSRHPEFSDWKENVGDDELTSIFSSSKCHFFSDLNCDQ